MGPETIIGQIRPVITSAEVNRAKFQKKSFAAAWEGQFGSWEYQAVMKQDRATEIIVDWADSTSVKMSAAQLHDIVFEGKNKWMLSANGTIFTYEFEAIITGLLKRWYAERQEMQRKMNDCGDNEIEREYWDKSQRVKKIILTCKILSKKIDDGLTPRHFFTVHNGNGNKSNAYKRSLTGRGNQGLMWGEGYINPPRGPFAMCLSTKN